MATPAPKKEPYSWAANPLKLTRAQKFIADADEIRVAGTTLEEKQAMIDSLATTREERVQARYRELAGHVLGEKRIRPKVARAYFPGDEEDD